MIADETLLGLCGEMLILHALLREAPDERVGDVIDSWKGHRETARDFQLEWVGVEVKTTTGSTSSHLFRGVHQLEPGHGVDDAEETSYMLASLGLEWTDAEDQANTTNLPELVNGIVERVTAALGAGAAALMDEFLGHIADYGSSLDYRHPKRRAEPTFARPFRVTFVRGYDMSDPAIQTLRSADLADFPMTKTDSVRYTLELPDKISGDVNPTTH